MCVCVSAAGRYSEGGCSGIPKKRIPEAQQVSNMPGLEQQDAGMHKIVCQGPEICVWYAYLSKVLYSLNVSVAR